MARSIWNRVNKAATKEIFTRDNGTRIWVDEDLNLHDAPPYKVGKQFPYVNASVDGKTNPGKIEVKSPEQLQREAAYLGKDRHVLPGKRPTHKHGGNGTVRRSSGRRPFRDLSMQRNGHSLIPIVIEA